MRKPEIVGLVVTSRADECPMTPVFTNLVDLGVKAGALEGIDEVPNIDLMVILGDRKEACLYAANAAANQVPIAHIHGGETSLGSYDNQFRHAITKLSTWHFPATDRAASKLIAMGEPEEAVFPYGAPGLDLLESRKVTRNGVDAFIIATFHPVTAEPDYGAAGCKEMIEALASFSDYTVKWSTVGDDFGQGAIKRLIVDKFGNSFIEDSEEYHSLCARAALFVGNSSAGIIEAPYMRIPSVNVLPRQEGREHGPSVIDAAPIKKCIKSVIGIALNYEGDFSSPYKGPGAAKQIAETIANLDLSNKPSKRW